jgi:hypothetical protein
MIFSHPSQLKDEAYHNITHYIELHRTTCYKEKYPGTINDFEIYNVF